MFDPINSKNIGRKAYAIKHIQQSFREAAKVLEGAKTQTMESQGDGAVDRRGILGRVLGGDWTRFRQRREKLQQVHV